MGGEAAVTSQRQLPHSWWWRPWVPRAEDPRRGSLPLFLSLSDLCLPGWVQGVSGFGHKVRVRALPVVPALCHHPTPSLASGSWDPSWRSEIQGPSLGVHAAQGCDAVGRQVVCRQGNLFCPQREI